MSLLLYARDNVVDKNNHEVLLLILSCVLPLEMSLLLQCGALLLCPSSSKPLLSMFPLKSFNSFFVKMVTGVLKLSNGS